MKREPSLADLFLATGQKSPLFDPPDAAYLKKIRHAQGRLQLAKRFVLDAQAIRFVGEICRDAPEAIAYAQEFAIPPFPLMFIEFDSQLLWHTVNDHLGHSAPPGGWGDRLVGFLIDGPKVYTITGADPVIWGGQFASLTPIIYHLNQPFKSNFKLKIPPRFEKALEEIEDPADLLFWGSIFNQIRNDPAMLRALRSNHSVEITRALQQDHLDELFGGCMGDLRTFLAIILLLNRTKEVEYIDVPMQTGRMLHRKPVALTKHRVITINLSPVKEIIRLGKRIGTALMRQSDVIGAYHHNKLARLAAKSFGVCKENTHDWQEDVSRQPMNKVGYRRWECLKCHGLMWFKPFHTRGNQYVGRVDSSYKVTRRKPPPEPRA